MCVCICMSLGLFGVTDIFPPASGQVTHDVVHWTARLSDYSAIKAFPLLPGGTLIIVYEDRLHSVLGSSICSIQPTLWTVAHVSALCCVWNLDSNCEGSLTLAPEPRARPWEALTEATFPFPPKGDWVYVEIFCMYLGLEGSFIVVLMFSE